MADRTEDSCRKGGKSDAGKGNTDRVSVRKIGRMNVKEEETENKCD